MRVPRGKLSGRFAMGQDAVDYPPAAHADAGVVAVAAIETHFKAVFPTECEPAVDACQPDPLQHHVLVQPLKSSLLAELATALASQFARAQCVQPEGNNGTCQDQQKQGSISHAMQSAGETDFRQGNSCHARLSGIGPQDILQKPTPCASLNRNSWGFTVYASRLVTIAEEG